MSFPFWREVRTCVFLTAIVVVVKKVCATIISSSGSTTAIVDLVGLLLLGGTTTRREILCRKYAERKKERIFRPWNSNQNPYGARILIWKNMMNQLDIYSSFKRK